ncbi:hypothetical protein BOO91_18860 [Vibrio navarrensis]|uniref:hypothetical protein n=1 Tax=Vibrio navarrensis TaxID=29495 RepID=UPI0018694213|nr:hypothetical protein [Vibrio navarrensis]MBE3662997.1 hypothetical protein [Vibrio navarrensis]MBE4605660.1 hypothetical protein [Vibrio navarrensis]
MNKAKTNTFLCAIALMFVAQNAYSAFAYLQDDPSSEDQQTSERDILFSNTSLMNGPMENMAPRTQSRAFNPLVASENIDNYSIYQQATVHQEPLSEVIDTIYPSTQVMHEMGVFSFKGITSVDDGYNETYSF